MDSHVTLYDDNDSVGLNTEDTDDLLVSSLRFPTMLRRQQEGSALLTPLDTFSLGHRPSCVTLSENVDAKLWPG